MKKFKLTAPVALIAAIIAPTALATDLSIGMATTGDLDGFTLKMGGEKLIGSFNYVVDETTKDGTKETLDLTTLTVGYKVTLIDNLEAYPLIGGGFYTYHDTKGESYSESTFVYGAGVRYTIDQFIVDYSFSNDKDNGTHSVSLGWEF